MIHGLQRINLSKKYYGIVAHDTGNKREGGMGLRKQWSPARQNANVNVNDVNGKKRGHSGHVKHQEEEYAVSDRSNQNRESPRQQRQRQRRRRQKKDCSIVATATVLPLALIGRDSESGEQSNNSDSTAGLATQTAASFCMPGSESHLHCSHHHPCHIVPHPEVFGPKSSATVGLNLFLHEKNPLHSKQSTFKVSQHKLLSPFSVGRRSETPTQQDQPVQTPTLSQIVESGSIKVSSISSEESGLGSTESDALLSGSRAASKSHKTASIINIAESGVSRVNSTDDYNHKRRKRKRYI